MCHFIDKICFLRFKSFFEKIKSNNQEDLSVQLPKKFSKKIYLDENELAAKKIIKIKDYA